MNKKQDSKLIRLVFRLSFALVLPIGSGLRASGQSGGELPAAATAGAENVLNKETFAARIRACVLPVDGERVSWTKAWAYSEQYKLRRWLADHPSLARQFPDSVAMRTEFSLPALQAALPEGAILFDLFVDSSRLYLFSLTTRWASGQVWDATSNWQQDFADFRAAVLYPDSFTFPPAAGALYQQYLYPRLPVPIKVRNPISAALASSQRPILLIVPDEALADLPFEVALTDDADSTNGDYASLPYLFRRYDVRYGPSAALLLLHPEWLRDEAGLQELWQGTETGDMRRRYEALMAAGESSGTALLQARESHLSAFPDDPPGKWGALVFWGMPPAATNAGTSLLVWLSTLLILLVALAIYWQGRGSLLRKSFRRFRSGSRRDP